jgi:alpha-amylase/alpha-mannosidase (GH57 family)
LVQKGEDFTPDDQQLVVAREREFLAKVLPAYAEACAARLHRTFGHALLPSHSAAAVRHQYRRRVVAGPSLAHAALPHPDDAALQIKRALDSHQTLFGVRPQGMWPSEGSVSAETLKLACREGIQWMATDEGVLGRSLDFNFARHNDDHLTVDGAAASLQHLSLRERRHADASCCLPRSSLVGPHRLRLFRNARRRMPPITSSTTSSESAQPLLDQGKNAVVSIILDGENAWEYYPQSGREFLRRFYDALAARRADRASHHQRGHRAAQRIRFRELKRLVPGSWIDANFNVWIGAPEDNRAWDLLAEARDYYDRITPIVSPRRSGKLPGKSCSSPKAATGTGGTVPNITPPTTATSTSSTASTSPTSITRWKAFRRKS